MARMWAPIPKRHVPGCSQSSCHPWGASVRLAPAVPAAVAGNFLVEQSWSSPAAGKWVLNVGSAARERRKGLTEVQMKVWGGGGARGCSLQAVGGFRSLLYHPGHPIPWPRCFFGLPGTGPWLPAAPGAGGCLSLAATPGPRCWGSSRGLHLPLYSVI